MVNLSATEARRLRLRAQGLEDPLPLSPAEVVARGVAFQGQDLPAVLRAIAIRSAPGTTVADVRAAFNRGEIVRGWTQRGTLFATTPAGYADLMLLTAERVARTHPRRREQLGIDADTYARAEAVAREVLAEGGATRAQVMERWAAAGIPTSSQWGYHLIHAFSLTGLMHWGPFDGPGAKDQLLVATPPRLDADADAALRRIARGYLRSHGPVLPDELAWWLALPKKAVRDAIASLGEEVVAVEIDGVRYLALAETLTGPELREVGVRLVPAFDEIYLGYQDRSLIASPAVQHAIVPGGNGVFRPAVLVDGTVVGTWRRAAKSGDSVAEFPERVPAELRRRVVAAVEAWPHG